MILTKKSFVETIFSSMKYLNNLIHNNDKCLINAFCCVFAGLLNYQIYVDKPLLGGLIKLMDQTQFEL